MKKNTLFTNDNLYILSGMNSESVDLIYLDPPFNSKRIYAAPLGSKAQGTGFIDIWKWQDVNEYYLEKLVNDYPELVDFIKSIKKIHSNAMKAYITYMTQRLIELHRVLKKTGSIYLHCDPTASHYLKVMMDGIFGHDNFRNEVVWCYKGPSASKKDFSRKHDIILRYSKGDVAYFSTDSIKIPYDEKTLKRRAYGESKKGGIPFKGKELQEYEKGRNPYDWWDDIPSGGQISRNELLGYPTQKPIKLLSRIIKASSNAGDIVLDPFCGCATTCVAAQELGRKWIGIDIEEPAAELLVERLSDSAGLFKDFAHRKDIPIRTDVKKEPITGSIKERLYGQQHGKCEGCGRSFEIYDFEVDHIVPKSKGGGDYYENYQLLCGNCNRIKGDRPMEFLNMKIEERRKTLGKITFGG